MPVEDETRRTLNMIRTSPGRAVRVADKLKTFQIITPERIDAGSGVYWVYGTSELETGVELETVFVVDTGPVRGAEDEPHHVTLRTYYWWIMDNWYPQGNLTGLTRLEIGEDEAFPFRWRTAIPLEVPFESGPQHRPG